MATRSLVLRESDPQPSLWEALLPDEVKRLPAELVAVDAFLDECFIAPWRALFSKGLGRPSVPVDTLLRLLYLEDRYQLGYESLCREIADSISWRRFCRIGLDRPVAKLAQGKLLRGRKLRVDTTVVEANIDYPTDADLLEQAVRKLGGLVHRVKGPPRSQIAPLRSASQGAAWYLTSDDRPRRASAGT